MFIIERVCKYYWIDISSDSRNNIMNNYFNQEAFEDINGIVRSSNLKKDRQYNGQTKKVQTVIYKPLRNKLNIEQHESH